MRKLDGGPLFHYFLNIQFLILWWILRLNKVFLVNSEDGNWVEHFLIVNGISALGGYFYFGISYSYRG